MGTDNNNNNKQPSVWGLPGLLRDRGPHVPLPTPPPPPPVVRPTLTVGAFPNTIPSLQRVVWGPIIPPLRGGPVEAQSLPKPKPFLPPSDTNKDPTSANLEKGAADDTFFTLRHRKVRISDRGSLYALCRSWLRNGYPEESQPQYGDPLHSLPKPLPPVSSSAKRDERDDESELNEDEDENTVRTLDANELLQGHIRRAKRIRARLREERLQRIKRYEHRLDLLLRPQVEQFKNDDANINLSVG